MLMEGQKTICLYCTCLLNLYHSWPVQQMTKWYFSYFFQKTLSDISSKLFLLDVMSNLKTKNFFFFFVCVCLLKILHEHAKCKITINMVW